MQKYKLYHRIRDLREDKDLTQKEAAEIINAGTTQYRRYESAETAISLEQAEKYADFYNVSLDYIAGRSKDKRGMSKTDLPKDEAELVRMYRELSDLRKGEIIGTIKTLYRQQIEESADERGAV